MKRAMRHGETKLIVRFFSSPFERRYSLLLLYRPENPVCLNMLFLHGQTYNAVKSGYDQDRCFMEE